MKLKNVITVLCQWVLGLTFLFSGLVKAIDPVGTTLKMGEYLQHFGMGALDDLIPVFAWALTLVESGMGLYLIMGRHRLLTSLLALLMMGLLTPLTLYLALANPVDDCGCFGDAVKLTNWQTFAKNVVLLGIAVVLYLNRQRQTYFLSRHFHTLYFYFQITGIVLLLWLGTWSLPYVDFRPYRPGQPVVADGAGTGAENKEPEYKVVYTKDGVDQVFSLDALPDESEGWEFKETLIEGGKTNRLESAENTLVVFDDEGEDVTHLLQADGYVMLLLSPNLKEASEHDIDRIENLYEYALEQEYPFYCLTLKDPSAIENWKFRTGSEYPFLYADQQIIVTIIRCNPGFMLLHNGVIAWKSQLSDIDVSLLTSAKLSEQSLGQIQPIDRKMRVFWIIVWLIAPLLLYLPLQIIKVIHYNKQSK